MAFDPRSLERLQELGRTLPKPLPAVAAPAQQPKRASEHRHKVETETDPEALFRELITVSADGTVPPHLLDRLRQAELQQGAKPKLPIGAQAGSQARLPEGSRSSGAGQGGRPAPAASGRGRPQANQIQAKRGLARGKALQPSSDVELQLYADFQDLLHLDPQDDPAPGPKPLPRPEPSDRLKPRPTDRRRQP
jgi:hypothetical protein